MLWAIEFGANRMKFAVEVSVVENGRRAPEYSLESDLNGEITLASLLDFTKRSLIITADTVLREEQAKGFDKNPVVVVDGRVNKPVINVNPLGKIEFVSRANIDDIILAAYQGVLDRSPVDTGKYIKSHFVFLNGTQVASDLPGLSAWLKTGPTISDKDVVRIVNIQPYARRLERLGVTAQRRSVRQVKSRDKRGRSGSFVAAPNGAYFLTVRSIRRKFKRNSSIQLKFLPGSTLGLTGVFKTVASGARGGKRRDAAKPSSYLYPTIVIVPTEKGFL